MGGGGVEVDYTIGHSAEQVLIWKGGETSPTAEVYSCSGDDIIPAN